MNSLSQTTFVELMTSKLTLAKSDFDELKVYGVQFDNLVLLEKKLQEYIELEADEHYMVMYKESNHEKRAIKARIMKNIKALKLNLQLKFGKDTAKSILFYIKGIATAGDKELINTIERVLAEINIFDTTIKNSPFIIGIAAELAADKPLFIAKADETERNRMLRKDKTEYRNGLKDKIYNEVTTVCEIGKAIWKTRDIKKFQAYVMFPGQGK